MYTRGLERHRPLSCEPGAGESSEVQFMDNSRKLYLASRTQPNELQPTLAPPDPVLRFGRFTLQEDERVLLVDGELVVLQPKAFDLLVAISRRPGHLFTRQQLLDIVWPGREVEENNLSVQVNALRKVLGNEAVATVPGRGYRFALEPSPPGGEPGLVRLAVRPPAPIKPVAARQTHLPVELPELIGRGTELSELGEMVDQHRLVTVTGAGGTGKTRLTQALLQARVERYEDGVCFIELAPLTAAEALPYGVAAALGIRLPDGDDPNAALASAIASMTILIALDNAEHLLTAVSTLARAVFERAPQVRVLVTSQVRLGLVQEWVYQLDALAVPGPAVSAPAALGFGSVALFLARARALDRRFALTATNVSQVVELCRRLDGSPLAIELAATRLQLLGLPQLLSSTKQRLAVLTLGHRSAPARQQTLRASLEWSHELLGPSERAVFRRMAVFVGSASLAMAREVLADEAGASGRDVHDEWTVIEALAGLVDRSLVGLVVSAADREGDEPPPRYRLLESPRALATELLAAADESAALQRRHMRAIRAVLECAYNDVMDGRVGFAAAQEAFEPEIGNGQAALRRALQTDPVQALAIGSLLSMMMGRRRHVEREAIWGDIEPVIDRADLLGPAGSELMARTCWLFAEYLGISRPQLALQRAQRALAFANAAGDARMAYLATSKLAHSHWRMGNRPRLRDAIASAQRIRQPVWSAYVLLNGSAAQAWLCLMTQDTAGAMRWFKEQAAMSTIAGLDNALAVLNIGRIQLALGQTDEALELTKGLVDRFRGDRNQLMFAMSLTSLCIALLLRNESANARTALTELLPLARQFEILPQWADAAALLAAQEGRARSAALLAGFADVAFCHTGQVREAADQTRLEDALHAAAMKAAHPARDDIALQRLRACGAGCAPEELAVLAFAVEDAP